MAAIPELAHLPPIGSVAPWIEAARRLKEKKRQEAKHRAPTVEYHTEPTVAIHEHDTPEQVYGYDCRAIRVVFPAEGYKQLMDALQKRKESIGISDFITAIVLGHLSTKAPTAAETMTNSEELSDA
jgi:hypothetical protein